MYRTYAEILARVKHLVNFNEGVTDQDFTGPSTDTNKHFRDAINEAYVDEVNDASQHGAPETWLNAVMSVTWPASQVTLTLPDTLANRQLLYIEDITSSDPGQAVWIGGRRESTEMFWLEKNKLQWGSSGPSSATTLRFSYVRTPEKMKDDIDEPSLIQYEHRALLVWSAAIILREVGDDDVPQRWIQRRESYREKFWKSLSLGQPTSTGYQGFQQTLNEYDLW
jgi:hypothetical protein